jgi:Ni,Fe-hydrogenase III large subunit/Ni,Fe-hydrogenase III component G
MDPIRHHREISAAELRPSVQGLLDEGFRLALVAGHDNGDALRIVYLLLAGHPERRTELSLTTSAADPSVPSLADLSFAAGRFERELLDLYGITPTGHPRPNRLVRHAHWPDDWHPMLRTAPAASEFVNLGRFPFLAVGGDGVYEIPVGPVHAGLIEPGHFRFSAVGESVLRLKARLWFVHRGVEKLFEGRPIDSGIELAERISGDTAAAHALAHALAIEDAAGVEVPQPVHRMRALLVEMERLYNHVTDLGALANDVGFSLANSHAQRVREQLLRINHRVTGHRLLRGAIRPGGVTVQALPSPTELHAIAADVAEIAELTLRNTVIYDRFAETAVLRHDDAVAMGCLGYVARASGIRHDARIDHPTTTLPVSDVTRADGDVLARYLVRRDEFAASAAMAATLIAEHAGPLDQAVPVSPPAGKRAGVGIVEGWRGTVVHRVEVAAGGVITRAKVVDPSWFNWPALPVAMSDNIVPDFPLANKSFNLSYAGNDL